MAKQKNGHALVRYFAIITILKKMFILSGGLNAQTQVPYCACANVTLSLDSERSL